MRPARLDQLREEQEARVEPPVLRQELTERAAQAALLVRLVLFDRLLLESVAAVAVHPSCVMGPVERR